MHTIAYPTEVEIDGPWLIDASSLQHLDSVLDSCMDKMRTWSNQSFEQMINEELANLVSSKTISNNQMEQVGADLRDRTLARYPWNVDKRQVTIFLSGGRTIEGARFSELATLAHVQEELPTGFLASARVGDFNARVRLSSDFSTELKIEASANNKDLALDIFGYLQNWQADIRPKKWQQVWLKWKWLAPLLFFVWIVLGLSIFNGLNNDLPKENVKREARALITQGVNASNQLRAEQLLLEIESDYIPDQKKTETETYFSSHALGYYGLSLAVLIALMICPKMTIGIWAGRAKIERERWWLKIISVTIPFLLLTGVLLPKIYHWFHWTAS